MKIRTLLVLMIFIFMLHAAFADFEVNAECIDDKNFNGVSEENGNVSIEECTPFVSSESNEFTVEPMLFIVLIIVISYVLYRRSD